MQSNSLIVTTYEHIHEDGVDLASLAGEILLNLREESFITMVCALYEILYTVSHLCLTLQAPKLCILVLPTLIKITTDHLNIIIAEGLNKICL